MNNVKEFFDRINNKKFSEEAISKEAIGKEEAAEMIQLINALNSEINASNSKNMESDNLPDPKLINYFIDKLNAEKLQNQLEYNSAVNSLEEIQPPLDTILTFLKHYIEENEMDNSLLSEIESLAETLKMDAQNKVEITDEDIQKMRDNIKTLLDYILTNPGKGSDIFKLQQLKDLTEKISKDNLLIKEEDREKINELKNDIENNKIYILDDERLKLSYAKFYFSDILNNASPNDSAFMYQKFFVGDKESNHMYQIIDLLHKLDSSNPTYLLDTNDIVLIMQSDDIIFKNKDIENKSRENIKKLFNDKDFRRKLYKLLISKVEPPSYIKDYYDIEPNTTPIVDGKPLKYAGDLFSGVNRGVTPVTYEDQAHIDVYNQMYSYYGGRAVLRDSGEYRLTPITPDETFGGFEKKPYIDNITKIVKVNTKNEDIHWTQGITKEEYSNNLVGDANGYKAAQVGNIDVGLVRLGPPPIVVDIGNKFQLDRATGFGQVLGKIQYSGRPLIQIREGGTVPQKADELTKASTEILEKYEDIKIADKSTVYLLKADIANYQQMFENFSAEDYAKSLYEAEIAKNTECDKITQADVNKEEKEKHYIFGTIFGTYVSDYHNWCKNDIAVKVNYLDTLKVKGIKNHEGDSMTIPEMRNYLNEQYTFLGQDAPVKNYVKKDIEEFLKSFITSILFNRNGTEDGILDQNITLGPDGKYKITNTIPGNQEASIDV